ncbi:MAG: alpha/beta hydrolase [Firmicutes bacterium]|nr:alpha/beta hydrolase [Bacillota bacterium]
MSETFRILTIPSHDKTKLVAYEWMPSTKPRGILLIVHGMCEHAKRYNEFAGFLAKKGFVVFAYDLRAHGLTAGSPENCLTYPDKADLFSDSVKDMVFLSDMLIKKHKLPLYVLGHSYGSFLTQGYMQNYNKHAGIVLSGSAFMRDFNNVLGVSVAGLTKLFKGGAAPCNMIFALSFEKYAKAFTDGSWLTREASIAHKYKLDPYCGQVPSANFYSSFFKGLNKVTNTKQLEKIDKTIPVLITSGSSDQVGGKNLKLAQKLYNRYKEIGMANLQLKIWQDGRHEILNETNRKEIYEYILEFLTKNSPLR